MIISLDRQSQTAKLSLRGHEILSIFEDIEKDQLAKG